MFKHFSGIGHADGEIVVGEGVQDNARVQMFSIQAHCRPAAYAALALELNQGGDRAIGDQELRWASAHVPPHVREILLQMPARERGDALRKSHVSG